MRPGSVTLCLSLSALAFLAGLVVGGYFIFSPSGGGFFEGLGMALGLVLIGTGNLVSCLLNVVAWFLGGRPRWLSVVLAIQSLPALGTAIFLVQMSLMA